MLMSTMPRRTILGSLILCLLCSLVSFSNAFTPVFPKSEPATTSLYGYNSVGKPYDRRGGGDVKSKRQERVGQLVQTELSRILHTGLIKGRDVVFLDDELRCRISVVSSDVSPDLRQARISVSVRASKRALQPSEDAPSSSSSSPAVDRRRAYAWLVRNTKPIRHTLAQRMSHMKSCPELTFVQVDVSAAVDVMYLIDKVTAGSYKRDNVNLFDPDEVARGIVGGLDFDDDDLDEDDDWDEDDGDFFKTKSS